MDQDVPETRPWDRILHRRRHPVVQLFLSEACLVWLSGEHSRMSQTTLDSCHSLSAAVVWFVLRLVSRAHTSNGGESQAPTPHQQCAVTYRREAFVLTCASGLREVVFVPVRSSSLPINPMCINLSYLRSCLWIERACMHTLHSRFLLLGPGIVYRTGVLIRQLGAKYGSD